VPSCGYRKEKRDMVIEIDFPLPEDVYSAITSSDPTALITRKSNLTGGEALLQIVVAVVTTTTGELIKRFLQRSVKSNPEARVVINEIKVIDPEKIAFVIDQAVSSTQSGRSDAGSKTRTLPSTHRKKARR
jgi:hypothetical protein